MGSSRSVIERLDTSVSAAKHVESKDIQTKIKSYAGCPNFTDEGKLCRSSLTTNNFIDPTTKKKTECNWYCLQKCSAKTLRPLLNIPKFMFATNEEKVDVKQVYFRFETETGYLVFTIDSNPDSNGTVWRWTDDIDEEKLIREEGADLNFLAEKLCQWFKRQNSNSDIDLICQVSPVTQNFFLTHTFSRFDVPFLRPYSMWTNEYFAVGTWFALNRGKQVIQEEKATENEGQVYEERDDEEDFIPWTNLPVGLAEEKQLVYHGVPHPNIRRIPREYRKGSQYRPRHFHSPIRKKVVQKQRK
jgi:hypothetical protein